MRSSHRDGGAAASSAEADDADRLDDPEDPSSSNGAGWITSEVIERWSVVAFARRIQHYYQVSIPLKTGEWIRRCRTAPHCLRSGLAACPLCHGSSWCPPRLCVWLACQSGAYVPARTGAHQQPAQTVSVVVGHSFRAMGKYDARQ